MLRRLGAVDDVAVLAGARAVDRDAARTHLLVGARRLCHDGRAVAAARQLLDRLGRQVGAARALAQVDDRRIARDHDGLGHGADRQSQVNREQLPEPQVDAADLRRAEALQLARDLIRPGCKPGNR